MRTNKKKKHQTPVTQGIDSIISTSQTAPTQTPTVAPSKTGGPRQPRGKGASTFNIYSKLQYRSKVSYHPLARRDSRLAIRDSRLAIRDSRLAIRDSRLERRETRLARG